MVTPQKYVDERLSDSLDWYRAAATRSRRLLYGSMTAGAALAVLVPVFVAFGVPTEFIALAGGCSAFATTLAGPLGWRDNWVRYRLVAEDLLRERWLFETRSGPYGQLSDQQAFDQLVQSVEELLLDERRRWRSARKEADEAASAADSSGPESS